MSIKVLVVDDSSNVRRQVALALEQHGYDVMEAQDGVEGLERVRATPDLRLVVCDVNMPRMNGIEMIETMGRETNRSIDVIMLTTIGQSSLVRRAAQAGAKAWLVKPFKAEHLLAAIDKLLANRRA